MLLKHPFGCVKKRGNRLKIYLFGTKDDGFLEETSLILRLLIWSMQNDSKNTKFLQDFYVQRPASSVTGKPREVPSLLERDEVQTACKASTNGAKSS